MSIVTDLTGNPATVSGTGSYPLTGLPSGVNFGFQGRVRSSGGTYYRSVIAGKMGGTASVEIQGSGGFAVQRAKGSAWNNGFTPYATALVAKASHLIGSTGATAHSPGSYSTHKYLSFSFKDASEGNLRFYGWVEISLANEAPADPTVTIYGYGYDDAGAQIATGEVPEPSSAALLALGALTFGARACAPGAGTGLPRSTPDAACFFPAHLINSSGLI